MRAFQERARRCRVRGCVLLLLAFVTPTDGGAQELASGLAGGALGLMGGGIVSIGIVTAEARRGVYLSSVQDVFGWEAAPMPVGLVTGLVLGLNDPRRGRSAMVGALVGGAAGAGLGVLIGDRVWSDPERHWAGGLIGGAAGLLAGAVAGALTSSGSENEGGVPVQIQLPVPK